MWNLSTQVNDGFIALYITVFDMMRSKRRRFITFLVYALVYTSIASNLATLVNLIPWSDSVCTHTYSPFFYETPLDVIQDRKNQATKKLLASAKYHWFLETPLVVYLRVG